MEDLLIIVVLCGIPGSGKTSVAEKFRNRWLRLYQLAGATQISFDDLENKFEWNESSFRRIRKENLNAVKAIIEECLHANKSATNQLDRGSVHSGDNDGRPRSSSGHNRMPHVIIIDDIMYLRSMRREIYVLARSFNIPVLTVHVDVALEVALSRNASRSSPVLADSVIKIFSAFQSPSEVFAFDRHHITLQNDDSSPASQDANILKLTDAAIRLWDNHRRCSVYINTSTIAVVSSSTSSASKEADKNFIKLLDEKLRKVSSDVLRNVSAKNLTTTDVQRRDDGNPDGLMLSRLGPMLSTAKAQTLALCRGRDEEGERGLDESLVSRYVLIFSELVSEGLLRLRDGSVAEEDGLDTSRERFDKIAGFILNENIS